MTCPKCKEALPEEASFCPVCGEPVPDVKAQDAAGEEQPGDFEGRRADEQGSGKTDRARAEIESACIVFHVIFSKLP